MSLKDRFLLDRKQTVLAMLDVQERLSAVMDAGEMRQLTRNVNILLETAKELGVPVVVTEHYPKGLGPTLLELAPQAASASHIVKLEFNACDNAEFVAALCATGRRQVVVVGMEAHVCVAQTVIGLRDAGYEVYVVRDAILSRTVRNWKLACEVTTLAGAIPTSTEAVVFQLLRVSGTPEFKKLVKLVK